jgi:hypothetical protein
MPREKGLLLFLRQQVKIELAAWPDINDFGKITGYVVCITTGHLGECKGQFQDQLRGIQSARVEAISRSLHVTAYMLAKSPK